MTIGSLNQSAEEWLKNVNALLEAEKVRHQLQLATFEELRQLNEAIANQLKKEAQEWH